MNGWRWRLVRTLTDGVSEQDFELEGIDAPSAPLGENEVRLATRYISLDPYLLLNMRRQPPGPCSGRVIGEVVESRHPGFAPGALAWGVGEWRDGNVLAGDALTPIPDDGLPPTTALGAVGRSGLTAWVGLRLAKLVAGETLVVSAATGPVGSVAGQLARLRGAWVIGIAGGAEKCRLAEETFGFHACLDHRAPELERRIGELAPEGVDVLFENVGAPTLDATLPALRDHARIMLCGMVAHYDDTTPVALRNFRLLLLRHLTLQSFATADYPELFAEGEAELRELAKAGRLAWRETIIEGVEKTPAAFIAMLKGGGVGKRLVRV